MEDRQRTYKVLVCTYFEPEHIERVREVDARLEVIYRPDLLGVPQYPMDHHAPTHRTPEQEEEWLALLRQADILYDFDPTHLKDLPERAPAVRWVQSTSAGIGQMIKRNAFDTRMPNTVITTASGVHAIPMAEFAIMAMLVFNKGLLLMLEEKQRKHWQRYSGTDLQGRTMGIIGLGKIGSEVARLANAFGMHVIGTNVGPTSAPVEQIYRPGQLHEVLKRSEYLVLSAPHTPDTELMIKAEELALLPWGALLINIGRGQCIDEPAMIEALRSGQLRGAALDVFQVEPLPPESPLWEMPNVLICPHSASTSDRENGRTTELFCQNLRRFLAGEPLLNVLDPKLLY